ncbi:hypothetical protein [Ancylobacter lacus]|uniref:hypothetical protein n=1 Tax=Ancylobacter lacus TaxID=2579970 RepID=UPI001BCD94C1|nr:hypothetical protein [Ancylobacter lacus]MBS7537620.1 hypothetical protein [Ancylobacter lacus]
MSLPDRPAIEAFARPLARRGFGLAVAGLLALATAGCFKPMYAESTTDSPSLGEQLTNVEIVFVQGRIGNEIRNDLIFALTGGAGNPKGAPYRLVMQVSDNTTSTIIDNVTGLPEVELVTVDAAWQLFAAGDDKKPLTTGRAFGKASIDSGYQRFARARALRDAQNRSANVAADLIKSQLAAWFVTHPAGPAAPASAAAAPAPAPAVPKS